VFECRLITKKIETSTHIQNGKGDTHLRLTDSLRFHVARNRGKSKMNVQHQRPPATCMFSLLQIGKCLGIENIWLSLGKYVRKNKEDGKKKDRIVSIKRNLGTFLGKYKE